MKKTWIIAAVAVVLSLLFSLPYIVDNFSANRFEKGIIEKIDNNEDITLISTELYIGNAGGTGNHTDAWVFVLLSSDLSEEELCAFFDDEISVTSVSASNFKTETMKYIGVEFEGVVFEDAKSYYIVQFIKNLPMSDFDLRGH